MARVVHFEIHADDPERAVAFYRDTFDWQIMQWEGPDDYWLVTTGPDEEPGINGAIMRRRGAVNGDSVSAYVCTVDVTDVDAATERVSRNGGQVVVPKLGIGGVGWLVYVKDTEGNILGMMQNDPNAI